MLKPKKPNFDKLLKDLYKKQQSLEKIDEENQFKSNYVPQSLKYQKQRKTLDNKKTELKIDSSTAKDKDFNKNIYDQKEWNDKKWGYAEDAASIAELGNFVPHPVAQGVGKAGAIASAALSARKAKLAYDNEDYVNMGLNLGMMGVSAGLGSKTISRSTPKLSKLDSFERAIAPKSFESNIINGIEIGRNKINVPSYINVLNQKSGQSSGNLLLNRGALGSVGIDLNTDFSTEQNKQDGDTLNVFQQGGYINQNNMLQPKKVKNSKTVKDSDFIKQWMNSPMYNKMLKKSDPENFKNNKQSRIDNYNDISVNYNVNRPAGTSSKVGGEAIGTDINVYDKDKTVQNRIVTHEKSHATDAPIKNMDYYINNFKTNIGYSNDPQKRIIPQSDVNLINKYKPNNVSDIPAFNGMKKALGNSFNPKEYDFLYDKKTVDYLSQPTETRARLNGLREEAFNNNIYNPLKEPISKQQYESLKNNTNIKSNNYNQLKDLKSIYNDDEIINLLNTVSQNNENKSDNIKLAAYGGKINTNMNRYAQGGDLTRFDEGGLHSQNPLGGVPIGNNNSVEQGETKQNNFIYSNRIFLDENIVSQYNLPKSLIGKSVADATKLIDNKFKGRNDKISQSTKNGMLSKIAEAQEAMKPQEPEMEQPQEGMEQQISPEMMGDPSQMAWGGFADSTIGQGFGEDATASQKSASLGAGLGVATSALDLGKVAFGKPAQDTSGLAPSAKVNSGGMIAGSAMKGAQAGMAFGPWGAAIGGVVGAGAGLLGSKKAEKAALENSNNYASRQNNQYSEQYAMGGEIDPPTKGDIWQTKNIVKYQPGVTSGKNGDSGFYLYSKDNSDPTFDYKTDREFVKNSSMDVVQKTAQWQNYMRSKNKVVNPDINLNLSNPIVNELAYGGKMNQMFDGGIVNNPFDKYSKQISSKLDLQSINQVIPSFINKGTSINNAQATIGTKVDGNFGKNSKLALDKYRQSKGMSNVGQPLSAVDYTAMGLTTDGYKINKNAFRQQIPENLNLKLDSPEEGFKKYTNIENNIEAGKDKKSIVGKGLNYVNDNLGNIARYAPIAANALQLAQLKKPQGERLDRLSNRYKPEYVDEASLQNIADNTMNNSVNAIGQSGASQGQLRSSIIGSQLQRTKAVSDAYNSAASQNRATNDRAQTFNLGVDQVNLNQSNTEKDINARDQAAYRNAKREYITGIGEGIGDIGKEQVYKKIIAKTTGYKWDGEYVKSPDGTVVTDPLTGKPMTQDKLKELQSTKDKKALGGYLIKNKVK